jgi:hypothetical protein
MKLRILHLIVACSCIAGCVVQPMSAKDMFGVSNPIAKVNLPDYGTMDIPTNARIRWKMDRGIDGSSKVDFTMSSNASEVVDAEGNRIDNMESQRIADFQRVVAQEQIRSAERIEMMKAALEVAKLTLPLLARPPEPAPTPASQSNDSLLKLRRELCALMPNLSFCAGLPGGTP